MARLAIPFRGNGNDGNFTQLMKLCAVVQAISLIFRVRLTSIYVGLHVQDDFYNVHHILREIAAALQISKFFSLMADEVTECIARNRSLFVYEFVDEKFDLMKILLATILLTV